MTAKNYVALAMIVGTFALAGVAIWKGQSIDLALAAAMASLTQIGHVRPAPKPEEEPSE